MVELVGTLPAHHPQVPPLATGDLPLALHALRTRLRIVADQGDQLSVADLDDRGMEALREQPVEAVAAATALWDLLAAALYSPRTASRLPSAPYRGPQSSEPWNVLGYRLLPAAVVLAGESTIAEALAGTLDPAGVADPGVEAAFTVYESARQAAAGWSHREVQGKKGRQTYLDIIESWDPFAPTGWGGVTSLDLWRSDLLWRPFTEAAMSDKELLRFAQVKGPLTYTRRYPSSPRNVEIPALRPHSRRADAARRARVMWVSLAVALVNTTLDMLADELHGDAPMTKGALFTPDPRPLTHRPTIRNVNVVLASGVRFPRPENGALPGLDQAFPEGDARDGLVKVTVDRPEPEDLTITVALPPRNPPALEDAVVGVVRIVADTMLTQVPELTDHARSVLTAWRNAGPGPFGGRAGFTHHVDRIVALAAAEHGPDWPTS